MLEKHGVIYSLQIHKPTKTSQESADVRKASLESGAKAMIVKNKLINGNGYNKYTMLVMSAAKMINWKCIRTILGSKKIELASSEEVK